MRVPLSDSARQPLLAYPYSMAGILLRLLAVGEMFRNRWMPAETPRTSVRVPTMDMLTDEGGGGSKQRAPRTVDLEGFNKASKSFCVGDNPRRYTKHSLSSCISACRARTNCKCVAHRESPQEQNCRLLLGDDWRGTSKSKTSPPFSAYTRDGAQPTSSRIKPQTQSSAREASNSNCRAGSGLSLNQPVLGAAATPPFFLYPPAFEMAALAECYARRTGRGWNASTDAGVWVFQALQQHPSRVTSSAQAAVFIAPTLAHLSEAAGSCAGGSHFARMVSAANFLRGQPAFQQRPQDHLVVNGVESAMRNPLGELGALVSSRGGRTACLDARLCGGFKPDRMLPLPWPSSPFLQRPSVRELVDEEACGRGRGGPGFMLGYSPGPRSVSLFFRGGLGASKEAQELRVRLPLLRQISGVQIGIVGSERLDPKPALFASKNKMGSINRLRRMDEESYARMMLKSKFCLAPAGDVGTPGARLFDAIAAGCVPILIGVDPSKLPLSRQLSYAKFTASITRSAFIKDPVYACESLMHRLEPALPAMLRALADARPRLLYGVGEQGPMPMRITQPLTSAAPMGSANDSSVAVVAQAAPPRFGEVAGLLLREHQMAVAGTAPTTLLV